MAGTCSAGIVDNTFSCWPWILYTYTGDLPW
jgi:hypothetical protein